MSELITAGGVFMYPLLICSVLIFAIGIERLWFLQERLVSPKGLRAQVINLLKNPDANGRIYVSTYQTILNQINRVENNQRKFGIGYFDAIYGGVLLDSPSPCPLDIDLCSFYLEVFVCELYSK